VSIYPPALMSCPECGARVEYRVVEESANYPGAMVFRGLQVKLGPEHEPTCRHYADSSASSRMPK
jgi:hypothetical protein